MVLVFGGLKTLDGQFKWLWIFDLWVEMLGSKVVQVGPPPVNFKFLVEMLSIRVIESET